MNKGQAEVGSRKSEVRQWCGGLLASGLCLLVLGCAGITPQSLETKAYVVTRGVTRAVLKNNPDNQELREGMAIAQADLEVIAAAPVVDMIALLEIVHRLPADVIDEDKAFYIEAGVLFFSDELGQIAIENPEMARAAARGMARGIAATLAAPPPVKLFAPVPVPSRGK